ncbi:sterol O-acyltransferase 1 [Clarias magur]|uniref:O-acyltransferase n=1 Tax=Clarias magur TaxID=1594786 RepID=A0A8J4U7H3_CLAMG|nr:sterol O-acyltransferase 1 [Clarias magur]
MKEKLLLRSRVKQQTVDLPGRSDSQLNEFVDSLMDECHSLDSSSHSASSPERTKLRSSQGQTKQFVVRQSLLDELFEVNHIRTIYHIFIAILILFILNTLVVDFIDEGRLVLDFDLLVFAFGQLPLVVVSWLCMFVSALVVPFTLLRWWAGVYSSSHHRTFYTLIAVTILLLYQSLGLGFLPTYIVLRNSLPPASSFILIFEQVRLMMKVHSFIRENVPRLWSSDKDISALAAVPHMHSYLYFLFAPTLIYRDRYPRNPCIRWSYVATNFLQFLGCVFNLYYVFVRLCIPQFRSVNMQPFDLRVMVLCIFNSILPGALILFSSWFAIHHCWYNAFAEMLRFGDRMFYRDWWNSTSFANYFRTWNVIVHDWLYYYIYRDFLYMTQKRFRAAAMFVVFTVSAVVHEYMLVVCFRFFYPVLFCQFMCFGMMFTFILHDRRTSPVWNIILWAGLFQGVGILVCLYSQEWYAQKHCPLEEPSFLDLLKPRSWTCNIQTSLAAKDA